MRQIVLKSLKIRYNRLNIKNEIFMNHVIYENETVNEVIKHLNIYAKENKPVFEKIYSALNVQEEREECIKKYINHFLQGKNKTEEISFFDTSMGLDVVFNHQLTTHRYMFRPETTSFEISWQKYKRQNSKEVEIEIIKNIKQLCTINFKINNKFLNCLDFIDNTVSNLDDYFSYKKYDNKVFEEGFLEDHVHVKTYNANPETLKSVYTQIFDIVDLSLKFKNNEYFKEKLTNTLILGKDLLVEEKDILEITCDVNLNDYNYKNLLIDLNMQKSLLSKKRNNYE